LDAKALRMIAIAYRPLNENEDLDNIEENGFIFIGLKGMIDPPRPEVKDAVAECRLAGIKTIMITGDHVKTAKAIAAQLGILAEHSKVLDGKALQKMSIKELEEVVEDVAVRSEEHTSELQS